MAWVGKTLLPNIALQNQWLREASHHAATQGRKAERYCDRFSAGATTDETDAFYTVTDGTTN